MQTNFWKENLKERKHLEDLGIDGVDAIMCLRVLYSAGNFLAEQLLASLTRLNSMETVN
jgi:hypothetical protein